MLSQRNIAVWNALGLTSVNGTLIISLELFGRALDIARSQNPALKSTAAKEGGAND